MALETNLVANYRLNDVNDNKSSFNLTNNNSVAFNPAFIGNGADFGTSNTNKDLTISNNLGVTGANAPCSISFWVKLNAEITTGYWGLISLEESITKFLFQIYYNYNSGTRRIEFNRQKFAVTNNIVSYNITLGTSSFHHVVLTYDGASLIGYVDTNATSPLSTTGNGSASPVDLFAIGMVDTTHFSDTIMDEVSVWTRAISSTEVSQLYNSGLGMYFNGTIFVAPGGNSRKGSLSLMGIGS